MKKNSHHYIWLFAGLFDTSQVVIAGYLNWIWTINTQVLRKIPVEYPIITVLDPKGIVFPFNRKKPDFEDEFAMDKMLGIPPDHWMFIETSPWPLKYYTPSLYVILAPPEKRCLRWRFKTPCAFFLDVQSVFFKSGFGSCNTWWYQQLMEALIRGIHELSFLSHPLPWVENWLERTCLGRTYHCRWDESCNISCF